MDAVPIFSAVVGITLAIVVDNEVVFVQTVSYNGLVAVLINLLVQIFNIIDLVRVKSLLAGLSQGSQLRQLCSFVEFWHAGLAGVEDPGMFQLTRKSNIKKGYQKSKCMFCYVDLSGSKKYIGGASGFKVAGGDHDATLLLTHASSTGAM